jgi:hypothetical protein
LVHTYSSDLPERAKSIRLPDNDRICILAMSRANENPAVKPVQPDVLPSLRSATKGRLGSLTLL